MTPAEIVELLHKHEGWLAGEPKGRRANLSLENLCGFSFYRADLRAAKLTGANLSRCDLLEADLSEADLFAANLQ